MTTHLNMTAGPYPLMPMRTSENRFGPVYIAFALDHLFLGVLCSQVWTYYSYFLKDPIWMKRLVGVAFGLSILKAAMSSIIVWDCNLVAFGSCVHVVEMGWTTNTAPLITTIVSISAQVFFVWRCYALTGRNRYFLVGLIVLMFAELIVSIGLSVLLECNVRPSEGPFFVLWALMVTIPIVLDWVITLTVSYKLLMARRGDNRNTDTLLVRLLAVTWQSALPPTLVQVAGMIHFVKTATPPMWNYFINELTASLYVVSLMYTLNSRLETRKISRLMRSDDYTDGSPVGIHASEPSTIVVFARRQGSEELESVPLPDISLSATAATPPLS